MSTTTRFNLTIDPASGEHLATSRATGRVWDDEALEVLFPRFVEAARDRISLNGFEHFARYHPDLCPPALWVLRPDADVPGVRPEVIAPPEMPEPPVVMPPEMPGVPMVPVEPPAMPPPPSVVPEPGSLALALVAAWFGFSAGVFVLCWRKASRRAGR